jgi:hypothetical protein
MSFDQQTQLKASPTALNSATNAAGAQNQQPKPLTPEQILERKARKAVVKRMAINIHIIAYIVVNAMLVGINYGVNRFENGIDSAWCIQTHLGWGIGLAFHAFFYTVGKKQLRGHPGIGAIIHVFTYLIIGAYLIFIDWFPDKALGWVYFALLPWGIMAALHFILVFTFRVPKSNKNWKDNKKLSWVERKTLEELQKAQNP